MLTFLLFCLYQAYVQYDRAFHESVTMAESADYASRQRLRPWLIAQINSGQIQGLCWLNEEHTKFKIPWKHAGKQDWNPSYSQIFTVRTNNLSSESHSQLVLNVSKETGPL